MKRMLVLALGCGLAVPACTRIEYSIALEDDLSGTARLEMSLDMERMTYVLASMTKSFGGDTTPVSQEELAAAREELVAQMEADDWDEEEALRDARADMPAGVEMVEFSNTRDGLKQQFRVRLAFDHVSSLNRVEIGPGDRATDGPGAPGEETRPFGGLEVIEDGNTIVLRNQPFDPIEESAEAAADRMPGMEGLMEPVLEDFSVVFRIEAPFEVLEDNATRRDGNSLIWEYDETHLETGSEGVYVRYKR
jgi:hypothetical protein